MAKNSKIEWTDHTTNLWWGCSKEHTGCKNCYAESLSNRFGEDIWGENHGRKLIKSAFKDLDRYQKEAYKNDTFTKVFVGSMMDVFENNKLLINPNENFKDIDSLRNALFEKIDNRKYDNIRFLFLTKRPGNINKMIPSKWLEDCPSNVWFGTSISNQETTDIYVPLLLENTPLDSNLFLSMEPQIGGVTLHNFLIPEAATKSGVLRNPIQWVIQGGESGLNRRPFNLIWADSIILQCKYAGISYFFKQIDKIKSIPEKYMIREFPNFN